MIKTLRWSDNKNGWQTRLQLPWSYTAWWNKIKENKKLGFEDTRGDIAWSLNPGWMEKTTFS